ncbi:MAG: hypothetical protein WCI76_03555 [bacterium]
MGLAAEDEGVAAKDEGVASEDEGLVFQGNLSVQNLMSGGGKLAEDEGLRCIFFVAKLVKI